MSAPHRGLESVWERRAVLSGIAFVVLFAVGVALGAAGSVDLDGTTAEVAARYDDNQTVLLASERILVLAGLFLFAFVGGLGCTLRRAEGSGGLPGVAVAAGAAASVLLLAAAGFGGIEVHEGVCAHDPAASDCSGAEGSLEAGAFSVLASLDFEFLVLAAIPFGIFLAATAIVVRQTRLLPRWLGTTAGVLAVLFPLATVVKFAALLLYVPLLVWIVLASVLAHRSLRAAGDDPGSGLERDPPRRTIPEADG